MGQQLKPAVAMAPNGGFVVVWQDDKDRDGNYEIMARGFNADGTAIVEQNFDFDLLSPQALLSKEHSPAAPRGLAGCCAATLLSALADRMLRHRRTFWVTRKTSGPVSRLPSTCSAMASARRSMS